MSKQVKLERSKTHFAPLKLEINIETEEELLYLWHLCSLTKNDLSSVAVYGMPLPSFRPHLFHAICKELDKCV